MASTTLLTGAAAEQFRPIPSLDGDALSLYRNTWGQIEYDRFAPGIHGSKQSTVSKPGTTANFAHRPEHDMESVYWVIVNCLLLAQPIDADQSAAPAGLKDAYDCLARHEIRPGRAVFDSRNPILELTLDLWRSALHPDLASLAPLLLDMSAQVKPEYALLHPPPDSSHLHEALRRILLSHIVRMEAEGKEIPITKEGWPVTTPFERSNLEKEGVVLVM
jgi:hypothetical protein